MPNRRRRKLSTAMSAVAALAVASPLAVVAVADLSANTKPAPVRREFVQATVVTDLPNALMSALSQGLSQFGINMPPMPTSLLTGSGSTPATMTTPGLGPATMTTPGLGMAPLTTPGLGASPLTTPGVGLPSSPATLPDAAMSNPALSNPALTSPLGALPAGTTPPATGLTTPPLTGLTTPPAGTDPALTQLSPTAGLPAPGEVPISAPIGLDPSAGTYPILGNPSLAAAPASGGGGLMGDLTSAASQLGLGQAIDLLKGVVMPSIMSAMKPGAIPAAPAVADVPAPPIP